MTCKSSNNMTVLCSAGEIAADISRLGHEISDFYRGKPLTLVGILNGALPFLSDLCRHIDLDDLILDTLAVSSYEHDSSTGRINFRCFCKTSVRDRHVLLVDDVLDTGLTLLRLREYFQTLSPASVRTCVYAEKDLPRAAGQLHADWTGRVFPNEYLIGYGLDSEERFRQLPYIAVYHPSC